MTRTHRAFHRLIWPVLALVVGFAFVMALVLRAPPPSDTSPATAQESRK